MFDTHGVTRCGKMVLEAESTITGENDNKRLRIYIPVNLAVDSAFPFKKGEKIKVKIDARNGRLVIEKSGYERG